MSNRKKYLTNFALVALAAAPIVIHAYETGPDPAKSGAPGDNPNGCIESGCHTGTVNSQAGGSISIKASGGTTYVPGQKQTITVTVTDPSEKKYGFQLSPRIDSNAKTLGAGLMVSTDGNTQVICADGSASPAAGCGSKLGSLQWVEHTFNGYKNSAAPSGTFTFDWTPPATDVGPVTLYAAGNGVTGTLSVGGTHTFTSSLKLTPGTASNPNAPAITTGGIVPLYSSATTIQPGSWVSIYGSNLASALTVWKGDFPTALGGTSVTINGKPAFLYYVSPTAIALQAPDDTATGTVPVVVTTANGTSTSTVTLGAVGPSFSLLGDPKNHVAGIIIHGATYDVIGPTGNSLGYATVGAKKGDTVVLFGVGFGPTAPAVKAGAAVATAGLLPSTSTLTFNIGGVPVKPDYAAVTSAGLWQFNFNSLPAGLPTGDVPITATINGVTTPTNFVIALQ